MTASYINVRVEPGELVCESGKTYPSHTCIGTIQLAPPHKINRWTPCGYVPRGYPKAADKMLVVAREKLIADLSKGVSP